MAYTDETILTFGEYAGLKLAQVPDQYLFNLYHSGKCFGPIKNISKITWMPFC